MLNNFRRGGGLTWGITVFTISSSSFLGKLRTNFNDQLPLGLLVAFLNAMIFSLFISLSFHGSDNYIKFIHSLFPLLYSLYLLFIYKTTQSQESSRAGRIVMLKCNSNSTYFSKEKKEPDSTEPFKISKFIESSITRNSIVLRDIFIVAFVCLLFFQPSL